MPQGPRLASHRCARRRNRHDHFSDVEPGDYAVALLHDENNDGKANRALGMMPKEGYGFSRDAKVRMGPPKFGDAVFEHVGEDQELTIKMRYFL
ncbi:MAG: DUF2141 domain-containing protein [Pseudomonadota bacterium]